MDAYWYSGTQPGDMFVVFYGVELSPGPEPRSVITPVIKKVALLMRQQFIVEHCGGKEPAQPVNDMAVDYDPPPGELIGGDEGYDDMPDLRPKVDGILACRHLELPAGLDAGGEDLNMARTSSRFQASFLLTRCHCRGGANMSAEAAQLDTPGWITTVLEQFEKAAFLDESDVAGHIWAAAKKVEAPTAEEKKAADAECWAFRFHPQTPGELSDWKTHFGPAFVSGDFRNPDIAWLDQAVVKYWEKRMTAAKHPLLRARYADLVWDLSKVACGLKPPIEAARIAIDGYVAAGALADAETAIPASDRLQRGLKLAVSVGDQGRAEQARDTVVDLFTRVNETWGWVTLFDIFEESPKIKLTEPQQDALVAGLESHITEIAGKPEGVDPAGTMHVAARLVRHYQRLGRQPEADRVVRASGQAAERRAAANPDHTIAHFWLDAVFRFYRVNGLDEDAERVQIVARNRGEQARGEAQAVPEDMDIPPDELENFVNELTEGGFEEAIQNIVGHYIPDLDALRDRLRRFRKEFPMATMWPIAKMSEGQMVAKIGPVDTDPDGALLNAVSDEISHMRKFLAAAFDRTWQRYSVTPEQVVSFLYRVASVHGPIPRGHPARRRGVLRRGPPKGDFPAHSADRERAPILADIGWPTTQQTATW